MMEIVLASGSPRRKELLTALGLSFSVRPSDVDETFNPSLPVEQALLQVAEAKAAAAATDADALIISADTIVLLDGRVLGKPADREEALSMLQSLSGRSHEVLTGVCIRRGSRSESRIERTTVRFRPCSEAELSAYVATGEPMDKAGAYGIQGRAALLIDRIEGDYYNVMGLPLCTLGGLLRRFGFSILPPDPVSP